MRLLEEIAGKYPARISVGDPREMTIIIPGEVPERIYHGKMKNPLNVLEEIPEIACRWRSP